MPVLLFYMEFKVGWFHSRKAFTLVLGTSDDLVTVMFIDLVPVMFNLVPVMFIDKPRLV